MRILLLVSNFPPPKYGGAVNYAFNIATHLRKNNEVLVGKLPTCPTTTKRYALTLEFVYNLRKEIGKLKKDEKIDIVYTITFAPQFSAIGLYVKTLNLPFVSHGVGSDIYNSHPTYVLARKIAYLISDKLICGVNFQKGIMVSEGARAEQVHAILGGVDTRIFRPYYNERDKFRKSLGLEEKFVLLSLGRLIKRKGFDDAIKALTYLDDIDEVVLLVAGKGPEKHSLIELAKGLSLDEKVIFLDFVASDYLPKLYNIADLFIAPFRTIGRDMEGFPLVVQEAQACGIPVISTNSAGLPELIENCKDGFIAEMNSPERIAEKVRVLHEDHQLRTAMARNARKRAEKLLDWNVVVPRIEKVLRRAIR